MKFRSLLLLFSLLFVGFQAFAQDRTVSGMVTDNGEALIGVSVAGKGTKVGTVTDEMGKFTLRVPSSVTTLVFSYVGYSNVEMAIPASGVLNVAMETAASSLSEVVITTGSRSTQRTITDSPIPVDILSAADLKATGQQSFDRALQYRVPSFNTVQTPVNDATSLLDPYEIRNMGPSRTLVLINGKRKNASSLVYIQTSPGRGEGGADISAIPTDAIERVEILRDGASAQYGSDAIAGVMNIILKDKSDMGTVALNTGITHKGDGQMVGFSLNNGATFNNRGFVNYTVALSHQGVSNRPGTVDAAAEADPNLGFGADLATVQAYLRQYPDARNVNGDPEKAAAKFLVNFGTSLGDNTEFYGNAAYVYKKVNSFANFRVPYWRPASERPDGVVDNPYAALAIANNQPYEGYGPTFQGDLSDYNGTVGFRKTNNGWKSDISFTTGGNKQLYTVSNSRNRSLGLNSPLYFKPGGYSFNHNVGNIDVSKALRDNLNFSIGTEFRQETYEIIAGDTASYSGRGADSFPGTRPENAGKNTRYNYGGYVGLAYDITDAWLVDGTARLERYSDFGNAFVYKLSSRYKISDQLTLRASYSTGFRAPMLQQIYLQIAQQSFVPGQGIQTKGIFNNNSLQAQVLGVPKLKAEESVNITGGVGFNPSRNLSFTIDYYNIAVDNRIILGSEIAESNPNTPLGAILASNGIVAASFWTNGINTRTSGIDFVASRRNLEVGKGKMHFNLAGNYTIFNKLSGAKSNSDYESGDVTKVNGDVSNPSIIEAAGKSVLDVQQAAVLLSSRPKYKVILGIDYNIGKLNINLNNTLFGPTTFRQNGLDINLKTVFKPAVVTDLGFNYAVSKTVDFGVTVQNILNILPKWEFKALNPAGEAILSDPAQVSFNKNLITFNNRYDIVTYDGSQFSQLGTILNANFRVKF